ncbi:MAG: Efflux transporter periplasmic adaptor subunit [Acidobacteriota bacterium]|nr:Efflux transporter periplasmic adaptor subunit [Acidobacteriota bacterium]
MKIKAAMIISLALAVCVVFTGCSKNNGDKKVVYEKKALQVKATKVKRGVLTQELSYKGTVLPWLRANIGPDAAGRVEKIYKKPGDIVNKNDLLAELDTTTLKLQEKQAEAGLAVANAAYKDALLNHQRIQKLYEKTAVSQMQLEKAALALEAADTQQKSAEAALNTVKHMLNMAYMRAPFAGIITSKNMEEGDIINPMMGMSMGSSGVLTLMDLKKIKITLDVPSEDIEKIKIGQKCQVKIETYQDDVFDGEIYTRNLAADTISKTFKIEVKVDNPEIKIKAGVFAEVKVEIFKKENILLLPIPALIEQGDTTSVVLYNDGAAKYKNIKVGQRNDGVFEVLEGLEEGQQVVVEGNYDLKEGTLLALQES